MRLAVASLALALAPLAAAQPVVDFDVEVVERTDLAQAPALHSGAWAEHDGLWVFVAGRTNGMHPLGGDAFPLEFAHGAVVVYDPATDTRWSASLDGLPDAVADPLRSTNGQHLHEGDALVVTGGYGWSRADEAFKTWGTWTEIDLPGVIGAVIAGGDIAPHVAQAVAHDDALAVAGGHLFRLADGRYALVGGHRYDGGYLRSGTVQTYTEAVRTFTLADGADGLAPAAVRETTSAELHRRDGNAAPTVLADGSVGIGVYGGVFTPDTQLPYLRPLTFDPGADALDVEATFEAHVGHYTSPAIPLYSASADGEAGAMHTLFLGGMGLSTWDDAEGGWRDDFLIPFVDDIGIVSQTPGGAWAETRLAQRMPGFLGTNAMTFLDPDAPRLGDAGGAHAIVDLDAITGRTRVAQVAGGIEGTAPNFGVSSASSRVFDVFVSPRATSTGAAPDAAVALGDAVPNPFQNATRFALTLDAPGPVRAAAFDATGRRVAVLHDGPLGVGAHTLTLDGAGLAPGVYVVRVETAAGVASRRAVVAR